MTDNPNSCFDLTLTEEQRITRESMRRFAEAEIRSIARSADEAATAPDGFYDMAAELGLSLMPIPEAYGGAGMPRSPISNILNAEDLAYGDMSLALGMLAPLGFINSVLDFGSEEQQERFLTPLASEKYVAASIAMMEPKATFELDDTETTASKVGDTYQLSGEKSMVLMASSARFILVIAKVEGEDSLAGFVIEPGFKGVEVEAASFMGLRSVEICSVKLNEVAVPSANRIDLDAQRLTDSCKIGISALALGCCQAVLDYVVPYVNERVAFGEPISHRQSVAFMVADMATEIEAMRMMVYRAASQAEQGVDFHQSAYLCQLFCAEHAMEIGSNGVQLLGGHGFIREHPVEMWYRNLRAVAVLQGAFVA